MFKTQVILLKSFKNKVLFPFVRTQCAHLRDDVIPSLPALVY